MSKASDDYLQEFVTTRYNVPKYAPSSYRYSSTPTQEEVKKQLPDILKWAMFADAQGLPRTRQQCEKWLAYNFTKYPDAYQHLCFLKPSSMVNILLLLNERIG